MDEDRLSASSADSDHDDNDNENDGDEVMEDAEEGVENDNEADDDNNDEDDDEDGDGDGDGDGDVDGDGDDNEGDETATQNTATASVKPERGTDMNGKAAVSPATAAANTAATGLPWRLTVRPEALKARLYDIVPTMAAPQSTSINAMAITPDMRYWLTGGSDGYIRKYDGPKTINGKLALTVAQKHPFVDSVTKAGILMSYWENEEPPVHSGSGRGSSGDQDHILSPVYSLAVQSDALWLLSGLESGGINLQSVRHDEGKRIHCLQRHHNAVSVLTLAQDERSVLSGGWDKNIFDWDLNTGNIIRSFDGSGGQISSIELRPLNGAPVPADADEPLISSTMSTNNGLPPARGVGSFTKDSFTNGTSNGDVNHTETDFAGDNAGDAAASPAHESLFGGSDAGSLFGDDTAGGQPFGHDEDEYGAGMHGHGNEGGIDHSADMASLEGPKEEVAPPASQSTQPMESMDVDSAPATQDTAEKESQVTADSASQMVVDTPKEPTSPGAAERAALKTSESPGPSYHETSPTHHDPSQTSTTTFLSAAIDGTLRIWDRRVPNPVARIGTRAGVPPWCMGTCWSPDGNMIYAGRRNGTVEEFDIRKARRGWEPRRVLKFPNGSGAVSAVRPMPNGRHLVCASHDILRLYDIQESRSSKQSSVPFLIIPGPPRAGVISSLYIDPTCRYMLSAAGTRGWEGTSTEALIGYEINVVD